MSLKLFAVYLGGRAPRANTELHDIVFAVGVRIEDTYEQLLDQWFGAPEGLHIDSWLELDVVDGWAIGLADSPVAHREKLFLVNLGAYNAEDFAELHAVSFHVKARAADAKAAALSRHFTAGVTQPHRDDLIDVDDCLAVFGANGLYVSLTRSNAVSANKPVNAYHPIPTAVIAAWLARRV
jgi:hypothetical protein